MSNKENRFKKKTVYSKLRVAIPLLLVALALVVVVAVAVGTVYVPVGQVFRVILKNWGLMPNADLQISQERIIYFTRFPRVVVAVLVGAALATSGTVMQGMFRNPMADPGILGISSGAGLGAVISIVLGLSAVSIYILPLFASIGAVLAVSIIYILSIRQGKIPTLTLILSGIAVSTFLGAISSAILTNMKDYQMKAFIFWSIGSLRDRSWEHAGLISIPVIICILILFTFARDLNIMLLGEEEAQSMGLNPSRTRKLLLVLTSITTAVAISVCGPISFIGLIVPHMARLVVGPDHRILLPVSALSGAMFLVICDMISRITNETSVGIVTSLLGAPYFLYLLIKARKEGVTL
jgi:ABC-type Fe3+-siderophore transport system, permease component